MKVQIQKIASQEGFTIPELLVVVFIIVLFSALVVPNWQISQSSLALQRSAAKVSQDIEHARDLALRAQLFACTSGSITGYGIYFEQSNPISYVIFADCNNNQKYDVGIDGIAETLSLENGTKISSVSPNPVSIAFVPPTPQVWINGTQTQMAAIILGTVAGSATKSIIINSNGIVSVQ